MRSRRTASSSGPASSARSGRIRRDGALRRRRGHAVTPDPLRRLADDGITLADGQRAEICLAVDGGVADRAAGLGAAASSCSSTTATPPPSSTTRSAVATARCGPTSATGSTTTRTPRRAPGPDGARRCDRRRTRRGRGRARPTSGRRPRPSSSSVSAPRTSCAPSSRDPATTMEDYLAVRSRPRAPASTRPPRPVPGHGVRARMAGRSAARRPRGSPRLDSLRRRSGFDLNPLDYLPEPRLDSPRMLPGARTRRSRGARHRGLDPHPIHLVFGGWRARRPSSHPPQPHRPHRRSWSTRNFPAVAIQRDVPVYRDVHRWHPRGTATLSSTVARPSTARARRRSTPVDVVDHHDPHARFPFVPGQPADMVEAHARIQPSHARRSSRDATGTDRRGRRRRPAAPQAVADVAALPPRHCDVAALPRVRLGDQPAGILRLTRSPRPGHSRSQTTCSKGMSSSKPHPFIPCVVRLSRRIWKGGIGLRVGTVDSKPGLEAAACRQRPRRITTIWAGLRFWPV